MRLKKWACTFLIVILSLGIGLMGFGFLLPYSFARADMPADESMRLEPCPDGSWCLTWPAAKGADRYRVELYQEDRLVFREIVEGGTSLMLPQIPGELPFTLRVSCAAEFRTLLGKSTRYGDHSLEAQLCFDAPAFSAFDLSVDGDEKTAVLTVEKEADAHWQYTLLDGAGNPLQEQTLDDPTVVFQFGEGGLAMPDLGQTCLLRARPFRQQPGVTVYGAVVEDSSITGESLQFKKLNPVLTETSKNTVSITWDETRGDHYEVQQLLEGSWRTLVQIPQGAPRVFTAWIEPGEVCQYRIAAADGQGQYPVVSEPLEFTGQEMARHATVWPTRDLAAFNSEGAIVDYAKAGQAYWVLEDWGGMFAVEIGGQTCYIDSDYCLINLPEYLGGLCSYSITNGSSSIYAIHEFPIPNVTGVVTAGYENVQQADGSCLVPLLYPTARRLKSAALDARDQGYRLKIYDAFRPYAATREIYDLTSEVLSNEVPDATYTGIPRSQLDLPEPRRDQDVLTLGWLMTGPNYELRSFLARDGSSHNFGIALDLTLEDLETGEEIPMQSSIHDLSHYSVLSENNDMADFLQSIMHRAGFTELVSEWWHFQDNAAREDLKPNPVGAGVSGECWIRDDIGLRYRTAKGQFYADQTVSIGGAEYTFDENGYFLG